jgi:hypothetical protein
LRFLVEFSALTRRTSEQQRGGFALQYLLLIYQSEAEWDAMNEAARQNIYKEYIELVQDLRSQGKYIGGHQLQPVTTATTARVREGKKLITDGPFAETREQLGGYFLVEAKDLDEALAIATRIPGARSGSIEVRPVVAR